VAAWILMQQELQQSNLPTLARIALFIMPAIVLSTGLLMVSDIRYPHVVNRYLRGKRSFGRLLLVLAILLMLIVWHEYTLAIGSAVYAFYGFAQWIMSRIRKRTPATT
jgi:phosphatidylserine synthase